MTPDKKHKNQTARQVERKGFEQTVLKSTQPVVVAFLTPWSRACRILEPVLEVVRSNDRAQGVSFVTVNADDRPNLSLWYEIQSIPTLLIFINGTVAARIVGTASEEAILAELTTVLLKNSAHPREAQS
jgi:thioredoxin 1